METPNNDNVLRMSNLKQTASTWKTTIQTQVKGDNLILWLVHRDNMHDQIKIAESPSNNLCSLFDQAESVFKSMTERGGPWVS